MIGADFKTVGTNIIQGQAYVYVRTGASWTEQAKLVGSDGAAGDYFGGSVAINKDTIVIGAFEKTVSGDDTQGQAYVFARSGAAWTEKARLVASDGTANDEFGSAVAIDGDTIVVGARMKQIGTNAQQGQAYVFFPSSTGWTEQMRLAGSDDAAYYLFGYSVAMHGNTAIIGAPTVALGGVGPGQAYVFTRPAAPSGTPCASNTQCDSGFCVDGVCCNTACGGGSMTDCQSCLAVENGGTNGTCGTIALDASHTCRPSSAICDKPELCDGMSTTCPADGYYQPADMHLCRAGTPCSRATYCDGRTPQCPPSLCLPPPF